MHDTYSTVVLHSREDGGRWGWWYFFKKIMTIQVYLCWFLKKQHKLTWLTLLKFLSPIYHHSHFLAVTLDFTTFFTQAIFNRATLFLQLGCFWVDICICSTLDPLVIQYRYTKKWVIFLQLYLLGKITQWSLYYHIMVLTWIWLVFTS